ncbi:MAG: hypothetical protein HY738_13845 [Bacteroidia bacterium]|nr:hypothetical protein [Bacteroidia bacterium]
MTKRRYNSGYYVSIIDNNKPSREYSYNGMQTDNSKNCSYRLAEPELCNEPVNVNVPFTLGQDNHSMVDMSMEPGYCSLSDSICGTSSLCRTTCPSVPGLQIIGKRYPTDNSSLQAPQSTNTYIKQYSPVREYNGNEPEDGKSISSYALAGFILGLTGCALLMTVAFLFLYSQPLGLNIFIKPTIPQIFLILFLSSSASLGLSILGNKFSRAGLRQIKEEHGKYRGTGFAKAGCVLSTISFILSCAFAGGIIGILAFLGILILTY